MGSVGFFVVERNADEQLPVAPRFSESAICCTAQVVQPPAVASSTPTFTLL